MKKILFFLFLIIATSTTAANKNFVSVKDGSLQLNEQPYRYIGTNLWYAPILASKGQGGDRKRLEKELDYLQKHHIKNLRILVGADAGSDSVTSVTPYLQKSPNNLNEVLLEGLDYLIFQMEKRDMKGVFFLTNSWDWSGGFGFYLREAGYGNSPNASGSGYSNYTKYASQFYESEKAQQYYFDYIKKIIQRTNKYTKRAYINEPSIMAWQICNEPRPFSYKVKTQFAEFIRKSAALIKQLDPNHLVSTGSEGYIGCEGDKELCQQMNNDPNIDYITLHIWPCAWGWASTSTLYEDLPNTYIKAQKYIDWHVNLAEKINKPIVIEEFGYPRDYNSNNPSMTTKSRDGFYSFVLNNVTESLLNDGKIYGCNFWGWAGHAKPVDKTWKAGMPYLCDPPHEPQGWYSVYTTDSTTLEVINNYIEKLN